MVDVLRDGMKGHPDVDDSDSQSQSTRGPTRTDPAGARDVDAPEGRGLPTGHPPPDGSAASPVFSEIAVLN